MDISHFASDAECSQENCKGSFRIIFIFLNPLSFKVTHIFGIMIGILALSLPFRNR